MREAFANVQRRIMIGRQLIKEISFTNDKALLASTKKIAKIDE